MAAEAALRVLSPEYAAAVAQPGGAVGTEKKPGEGGLAGVEVYARLKWNGRSRTSPVSMLMRTFSIASSPRIPTAWQLMTKPS
jgi:hypothetical protein